MQHTGISPAALLDELTKIAEESASQGGGIGKALRSMGVAAAGGAAGYGAAEMLGRKMKFFNQASPERLRAARIILPILSGTAVMLADRYRQKLNKEYSQVKGYREE